MQRSCTCTCQTKTQRGHHLDPLKPHTLTNTLNHTDTRMHPGYGEVEQVTSQEVQSIPLVCALVPNGRRTQGSLRKLVFYVDFWKNVRKFSLCVDLALKDYEEPCGGQGSVCSTDLTNGAETDRRTNSGVKWDGGGGLGQMSDRAKCWQPYHQLACTLGWRWEREVGGIRHDNFRDGSRTEEGFQEEDDHISRAEGGGKGLDDKIYIKTLSKEKDLLNKTKWDDGLIRTNICRTM